MNNTLMEKTSQIDLIFYHHPEQMLQPRHLKVSFTMYLDSADKSDLAAEKVFRIAYVRIVTMLEEIIDQSLIIGVNDYRDHCQELEKFNNNLLLLPRADESTLGAALLCKFNAIVDPDVVVSYISIVDESTHTRYSHSEYENIGEIMPDISYVGGIPLWDKPWWSRSDTMTFDNSVDTQEERNNYDNYVELTAFNSEKIWQEIDSTVGGSYSMASEPANQKEQKSILGELVHVDFHNR